MAALCGSLTAVPAALLSRGLPQGLAAKLFGALFIIAGVHELFAKK